MLQEEKKSLEMRMDLYICYKIHKVEDHIRNYTIIIFIVIVGTGGHCVDFFFGRSYLTNTFYSIIIVCIFCSWFVRCSKQSNRIVYRNDVIQRDIYVISI